MKRTPLHATLVLLLFLTSICTWAQQKDYVVGKLVDAETQEPIAFASVMIKGKSLGVISNIDGGFKIPIRHKIAGDTLEISSMGYERLEVAMSVFSKAEGGILSLSPHVFDLQEVVVTAQKKRRQWVGARRIVRRAIRAIPDNYPTLPFSTIGYYRDYQVTEREYLNLNEAILEVFDTGFSQPDEQTEIKIYEYKPNLDFDRDTLAARSYNYTTNSKVIRNAYLDSYGGNEFVILRVHDAIRNYKVNSFDFVNKIEEDLFKNHVFQKEEDTYIEGEALYTIRATKKILGYRILGRFYISKDSYAIHKMEYTVFDNSRKARRAAKKQNATVLPLYDITTAYTPENSKMYLSYISFRNSFQLARPPEFVVNKIVTNRQCNCFEVQFNKDIEPASSGSMRNYSFKYRKKRIPFKEVVVFHNAVRLFPDMPVQEINEMFDVMAAALKKEAISDELFSAQFGEIQAADSLNKLLLNEYKLVDYQQFREYFVQQLKPYMKAPGDSLFMDKKRPIFKDQPMAKPGNFDDYWMNTPLQPVDDN